MKQVNPEFKVIGQYEKSDALIEMKCNKGHSWKAKPYNLLHGTGCPQCSIEERVNNMMLDEEEFLQRVHNFNPDVILLTPYNGWNNPGRAKCLLDNHEWDLKAVGELTRAGCPKCNEERKTSYFEQLLYQVLAKVLAPQKVLNRDKSAIEWELDIFVPELKIAIEPGSWFFHEKYQWKDNVKIEQCRETGIELLIIYTAFPNNAISTVPSEKLITTKKECRGRDGYKNSKPIILEALDKFDIDASCLTDDDWQECHELAMAVMYKNGTPN